VATAAPKPTAGAAADQAIADFYRGKTIRIVVAFGPGGTYDSYSRFVAAHLPKYLAGSPTVVVENKPGGGGLIAANGVYNSEPRDGTVILSITEDLPLQQIIAGEGVAFEADKFQWLGASVRGSYVCGTRTGGGVSSLDDLLAGKQLVMGTISPSNATHMAASVLNVGLGTNLRLVTGYADMTKIKLAMQSGEVDGTCGGWDGFTAQFGDLLEGDNPAVKVLVSLGQLAPEAQANAALRNIPVAESLARTEEAKQLIRAVNASPQIAKPFAFPPGVPPERVTALRQALAKTYVDPDFLAQVKQARLYSSFVPGEDVQQTVQDVLKMPAPLQEQLKALAK
jgi:tripartite-type tricarboxylate transporter receptor subunit TctC